MVWYILIKQFISPWYYTIFGPTFLFFKFFSLFFNFSNSRYCFFFSFLIIFFLFPCKIFFYSFFIFHTILYPNIFFTKFFYISKLFRTPTRYTLNLCHFPVEVQNVQDRFLINNWKDLGLVHKKVYSGSNFEIKGYYFYLV